MSRQLKSKNVYITHLIISILLIGVISNLNSSESSASRLSEDILSILNIASFLYFIVSAYKVFFYKRYSKTFQIKENTIKDKQE